MATGITSCPSEKSSNMDFVSTNLGEFSGAIAVAGRLLLPAYSSFDE
jgi:hypothetical protein